MNPAFEQTKRFFQEYMFKNIGVENELHEGMRYAMQSGKRLRPVLLLETYRAFGANDFSPALPFALALEMIHNYSLVHDDLPAMDNDYYRRGELTVHAKYGEAHGILIGDALLTDAFGACMQNEFDPKLALRAMNILIQKAGSQGMIFGQILDIYNQFNSVDDILFMYRKKTSALIEAGAMMGAILAGCGEDEVNKMERFGIALGLAFQIQDDLLDREQDRRIEKQTSLSFWSPQEAYEHMCTFSQEAKHIVQTLPKPDFLMALVADLIDRRV